MSAVETIRTEPADSHRDVLRRFSYDGFSSPPQCLIGLKLSHWISSLHISPEETSHVPQLYVYNIKVRMVQVLVQCVVCGPGGSGGSVVGKILRYAGFSP